MKTFIAQMQQRTQQVLEIHEPHKPQLTEEERKDLLFIQTVHDILDNYLTGSSDCPKDELPIDEEQLV